MEFKKLMLLQLFAEEGGEDPKPENSNVEDPKPDPKDDPKPDQRIIFPDKQSFMARVKREANKQSANAKADFLKDLGIADEDTLKSIIADYNTQQEKNKTELDKALETIKTLQDDNMKEMFDNLHNCKYRDCMHIKEDACHVKKLLEEGKILPSRYNNYKSFIGGK